MMNRRYPLLACSSSLSLLVQVLLLSTSFVVEVSCNNHNGQTPWALQNNNIQSHVQKWTKDPEGTAEKFGHISIWDTRNVTSMRNLFAFNELFNEDISMWDVSGVTDFGSMFWSATAFDHNLGNWDVRAAQNFECMFCGARRFRGEGLANWRHKLTNVDNMFNMFEGSNIQEDLSQWNVSSVTNFRQMFMNTPQYEQQLCWEINPMAYGHMQGMFNRSSACLDKGCVAKSAVMAAGCSSAMSWKTASIFGMAMLAGAVMSLAQSW